VLVVARLTVDAIDLQEHIRRHGADSPSQR
jgi:ribosomal protein S15P/S13E